MPRCAVRAFPCSRDHVLTFAMSTAVTVGILASLYLAFFLIERIVPLRQARAPLPGRLLVNFGVSAAAFATAFALVRSASDRTLEWTDVSGFGLLQWLDLPAVAEFAIAFLLLDLTFYYWHVANHRFSLLWRIHNVHHVDPDLDVSTAFRFHFAEVALSTGFRVLQIALIGPAVLTYAIYEVAFQAGTLFHHSNIRLPEKLERRMNLALVTPRMHGIHHSQVRKETNSNFGVVFSWWDRLHRTLGLDVPQARIVIGIPGYSRDDDNRLSRLFAQPFAPQRDYWKHPDGF
jgi:sterol desaturase/sphingolipid hydroxylase (fatty acid hydroxylase superfamily)